MTREEAQEVSPYMKAVNILPTHLAKRDEQSVTSVNLINSRDIVSAVYSDEEFMDSVPLDNPYNIISQRRDALKVARNYNIDETDHNSRYATRTTGTSLIISSNTLLGDFEASTRDNSHKLKALPDKLEYNSDDALQRGEHVMGEHCLRLAMNTTRSKTLVEEDDVLSLISRKTRGIITFQRFGAAHNFRPIVQTMLEHAADKLENDLMPTLQNRFCSEEARREALFQLRMAKATFNQVATNIR